MKWYHILIIILAILVGSLAFAVLPLKSGLGMIFTTIFVFYFTGKSYIWDKLSGLKLHLLRLEQTSDMRLHHLVNSITTLSAEILTIKALLKQEIRERQQDKVEEPTNEAL